MPRVKGIFVSPSGQIVHAAVGFDDYVVETVPPKIRRSPFSKYNDEPVLIVVDVPVTASQYALGNQVAERLESLSESYVNWDTIEPSTASALVYTAVFRAMFPQFLLNQSAASITLQSVYDATAELLNTHM